MNKKQKLSSMAHLIIVSWQTRIVLQVWPIPTLMPLDLTCYMYKSSLRYTHNPVLSSLKMESIFDKKNLIAHRCSKLRFSVSVTHTQKLLYK
jgi:hypothetical protein